MEVSLSPPPDMAMFANADYLEQLLLMSESWHDQTQALRACNVQLSGIRDWKTELIQYHKENDKGEP
jgi:hypothetical protein